ncbi:GHMP kinase family protein [Neorickettsia helminthoeca str. Oregon]|uniref:4-diphosphocytidyl-2-C-methyl-D-erythritol kinase n=1 Tax=Neorickettsia helminthoeca str. Oregon TaxID=1286528 RepID=X5HMD0_9RICK|nr:4-diphosphocytidyl-2C-methyl-D-erythritol kinase [Neorickettsia helminthoeca]AHX11615.1 GHMP kinase family protein [Neorickettsia helminthoeca str. Oregon]
MKSCSLVVLRAPAKINLFLLVTGRDSGFHLIDSFFCFTHDFCDTIELISSTQSVHSVEFLNASHPIESQNSITKVLSFIESYADSYFDVRITKNIPVAAGMGGGSADAAALLRYFSSVYSISAPVLREIALSIGLDTIACLHGSPCHVTGKGEQILPLPKRNVLRSLLLVCPKVAVDTSMVYRCFHESDAAFSAKLENVPDYFTFEGALTLPNDLTDAAICIAPVIRDVLNDIRNCVGNKFAKLCGSGPTCIGVFDTEENLGNACSKLRRDWWAKVVQISL